jgi:uncharacterized protein YbjT (DUF2867 family)
VDVVINAVGILRSRGKQTLEALHTTGPRALFAACVGAGVRRVIQISALGAAPDAPAEYHRSKDAADRYLVEQPLDSVIVQPSLVYGAGGTSARLFDTLASLPLIPLPAGGTQRVQPVHVDDLVQAIVQLAESPATVQRVIPVVGPMPMSVREFLLQLRGALGLGRGRTLSVPRVLVHLGAWIGGKLPGSLLYPETLAMLERGSIADPAPLARLLGRPALPVSEFITEARRESRRISTSLRWLLPLLRLSVAVMWFIAALVSMGPYPVADSLALLRSIGIPAEWAPLLLVGAIGTDLAFGVMTLLPWRPRWLWPAQIAVVLVYTLIITWRLPLLWLEPFGPVAKNLPILALLLLLQQLEERK